MFPHYSLFFHISTCVKTIGQHALLQNFNDDNHTQMGGGEKKTKN